MKHPQQMQKKVKAPAPLPTALTLDELFKMMSGLHYDDEFAPLFENAESIAEVVAKLSFTDENKTRVNEFLYLATPLAAAQNAGMVFSVPCTAGELSLFVTFHIATQSVSVGKDGMSINTKVKVDGALLNQETIDRIKAPVIDDETMNALKEAYRNDNETLQ